MRAWALVMGLMAGQVFAQPATRVVDFNATPANLSSNPREFVSANGLLYFIATTRLGSEVWVTDGTEAGTRVFRESIAGAGAGLWFRSRQGDQDVLTSVLGKPNRALFFSKEAAAPIEFALDRQCNSVALAGQRMVCSFPARGSFVYTQDGASSVLFGPTATLSHFGTTADGTLVASLSDTSGTLALVATDGVVTTQTPWSQANVQGPQSLPGAPIVAWGTSFDFFSVDGGLVTVSSTPTPVGLSSYAANAVVYPWRDGGMVWAPAVSSVTSVTGSVWFALPGLSLEQVGAYSGRPRGSSSGAPTFVFFPPVVVGDRLIATVTESTYGPPSLKWFKTDGSSGKGLTAGFATDLTDTRDIRYDLPSPLFAIGNALYGFRPTVQSGRMVGTIELVVLADDLLSLARVDETWVPSAILPNPVGMLGSRAFFAACRGRDLDCELASTDGQSVSRVADLWQATDSFSPLLARQRAETVFATGTLDAGSAFCEAPRDGGVRCALTGGLEADGPSWASAGWLVRTRTPDALALRTDGGWLRIDTAASGSHLSRPGQPVELGDGGVLLPFVASEFGSELFTTGGTNDTTVLVADLWPGPLSSEPVIGVTAADQVYFAASTPVGRAPFVTNGSAAGTSTLATAQNGLFASNPTGFAAGQSVVVFAAYRADTGRELWATNGTPAGTRLLGQSAPGVDSLSPQAFAVYGGSVVSVARAASGSLDVLLTPLDGGAPVMLALNGAAGVQPQAVGPTDAGYLFSGLAPDAGRELYVTDGTAQGTHLLLDLNSTGSSAPELGLPVNGRLYFAADDGQHGRELWVSDGTPQGTFLAADVSPGPLESNPTGLTWYGARLLFSATDLDGDREVWGYPLDAADDNTAPIVIAHRDGRFSSDGWALGDVSISFEVIEPDGPVQTTGCEASIETQETAGSTRECVATSRGGTSRATVGWKKDVTAPTLDCAASQTLDGRDGGAQLPADIHAFDAVDPAPRLEISPPPGTRVEPGRLVVTATATDFAGNVSRCQVAVLVEGPTASDAGTVRDTAYLRPGCGCDGTHGAALWALIALGRLVRRRQRGRLP